MHKLAAVLALCLHASFVCADEKEAPVRLRLEEVNAVRREVDG